MVCSPEQARLNGAKSKGPTTEQGKAIAARNATKHGLLAKQPPLLVTEDLATFEGLMQGLIDQYQPENPVEHFLVQQVAMAMVRQYRLWNVEAAIANLEVLKAQRAAKFPSPKNPDFEKLAQLFDHLASEQKSPKRPEKDVLEGLLADLEYDLAHRDDVGDAKTVKALKESLGRNDYREDRSTAIWVYHEELNIWLYTLRISVKQRETAGFDEVIIRINRLIELAQQRLDEINQAEEDRAQINRAIQQAEIEKQGVQQPELFSRYQRSISRDLHEALDRLEAMQERKIKSSMGSFGQTAPAENGT
jgi:hypothetical protein